MMDAAPGRHTGGFGPTHFSWLVINAAGLCLHVNTMFNGLKYVTDFLKAVTGWDRSEEEILKCGERIGVMRHVFTLREGDNPLNRKVHGRIVGKPPQTGRTAGRRDGGHRRAGILEPRRAGLGQGNRQAEPAETAGAGTE